MRGALYSASSPRSSLLYFSLYFGPSTFLRALFPSPLLLPSCFVPVRSFVRTSLARPVPPFRLFRFFLSIGPGLVMHLNNLFISDSTLRATRPLVIMRGKHSRCRENVFPGIFVPPAQVGRASVSRFVAPSRLFNPFVARGVRIRCQMARFNVRWCIRDKLSLPIGCILSYNYEPTYSYLEDSLASSEVRFDR